MFEKRSFYVLIRKMYGLMWRAVTDLSSYVVNRMLQFQIVRLPMVSPRWCAQDTSTSTPTPYHRYLYRTSFFLQISLGFMTAWGLRFWRSQWPSEKFATVKISKRDLEDVNITICPFNEFLRKVTLLIPKSLNSTIGNDMKIQDSNP